jgi:hypothetical protein
LVYFFDGYIKLYVLIATQFNLCIVCNSRNVVEVTITAWRIIDFPLVDKSAVRIYAKAFAGAFKR